MSNREKISVVWLKRDLRLQDNEAITKALQSGNRVLFLFVFENLLINDLHYSKRHWNFIKQSLEDLNEDLKQFNTQVLSVSGDIFTVFNQLLYKYNVTNVYSHQETGLLVTFNRDKEFLRYCRNNSIEWKENINNGVLRGLLDREDWFEKWESYMYEDQVIFNPSEESFLTVNEIETFSKYVTPVDLITEKSDVFQPGGSKIAWKYANSFFEGRYENYMFHISKPEASRTSCSRLSPYIAWGNISIRQVFQKASKINETSKSRRHLSAFISRLRWQAHFIQKFEMEHTMENASVNKGYHKIKKSISETYIKAWETGNTGFPLVDASMRCLNTTGFINFRMRAMLVSFFTHILWQPWQEATHHLSRMFLDFEPGIHFPQLQMNAGETGINEIRIYSPAKNAKEHDPDATFIKKWVPELAHLPVPFIHEPYLMTPLDQQFNNCVLGKDYVEPIVSIKENRSKASEILWNMRNDAEVRKESLRILKRHTINRRNRMLGSEQ